MKFFKRLAIVAIVFSVFFYLTPSRLVLAKSIDEELNEIAEALRLNRFFRLFLSYSFAACFG